ncbi:MAG: choice-of-anchor J domain-containing protein, partial [bacterium]
IYPPNAATSLIRHTTFQTPPASANPRLRFWHWFENWNDVGYVRVRVNGGALDTLAGPFTNTGSSVWTHTSIDLSAYEGMTLELQFYFRSNNDGARSNGWYIDDVAILTGPLTFNSPEGWESGLGDWYVENGTWQAGNPTSGPDSAFAGQNCAATVLDGIYHPNLNTRLVSPPFQVPADNPRLRFWQWYSNWNDAGLVQVRIAGGNWQTISQAYNNTGGGVWTYTSFDLSAFSGSEIQIAFLFTANSDGARSSGWYIDEVAIITGAIVFNNPENWDADIGDWSVSAGSWEVGTPTAGPDS